MGVGWKFTLSQKKGIMEAKGNSFVLTPSKFKLKQPSEIVNWKPYVHCPFPSSMDHNSYACKIDEVNTKVPISHVYSRCAYNNIK
jgi:hypothetical protein